MPTSTPSSSAASRRTSAENAPLSRTPPVISADRSVAWLAGAAVLALPFLAFASVVLRHFYTQGSFLLDAGWTAYLTSHGGLTLPYPRSLGGQSYFNSHVGPILIATGLLWRALPLSSLQYFAAFTGLCHALPAMAVFWLLRSGYGLRRGLRLAAAALVAVAFAGNGLAWAIARYPHSEILVVGALMLFAVALAERRVVVAAICLTVALLTREDAGLHAFALVFVLAAVNRFCGVPWRAQRIELAFAAAAFVYSTVALVLQRALSTMPSTLTLTYLGNPPFAHLSIPNLLLRLQFVLTYRAYLVLPALVAAVWAIRTRNLYILVGYIAFLPWVVLQLLAFSGIAGTLSGYYAYPLMIAAFWPLVGVLLDRRRGGSTGAKAPIAAFLLMIAASFASVGEQYNPGHLQLPRDFFAPPSLARQLATERAMTQLAQSKPVLGNLVADTSVVALAPDDFAPGETFLGRGAARPNTVIYFVHGYEADKARAIAAAAGLNRHYRVPGTSLRLATTGPITAAAPIAALLLPDIGAN